MEQYLGYHNSPGVLGGMMNGAVTPPTMNPWYVGQGNIPFIPCLPPGYPGGGAYGGQEMMGQTYAMGRRGGHGGAEFGAAEPVIPPAGQRRNRAIYGKEQLNILEATFENDRYPDVITRTMLMHTLGISESRIQVWFANRRAKWRRQRREEAALEAAAMSAKAACRSSKRKRRHAIDAGSDLRQGPVHQRPDAGAGERHEGSEEDPQGSSSYAHTTDSGSGSASPGHSKSNPQSVSSSGTGSGSEDGGQCTGGSGSDGSSELALGAEANNIAATLPGPTRRPAYAATASDSSPEGSPPGPPKRPPHPMKYRRSAFRTVPGNE